MSFTQIKVRASTPSTWDTRWVRIDNALCKPPGTGTYGKENGPYCSYQYHPLAGKDVLRVVLLGPKGGDRGRFYFTKEQAMELISALQEMASQLP